MSISLSLPMNVWAFAIGLLISTQSTINFPYADNVSKTKQPVLLVKCG